jgi:MoaA/NifB/PqqE/SkfB family radical SAM enzyme
MPILSCNYMVDRPRADIRVGYLCNNNCRFCCVAEQRNVNLTTDQIVHQLREARRRGAEKVVFTGGEPTIRRDIFTLLAHAKSIGYEQILVITNGRLCSYEGFMDKLVQAGLTDISFSFPDHRRETYDYLTQVKGGYDQLMKAMTNAKNHNLAVSTITVITKLNYEHLPAIAEELAEYGKSFRNFFSEYVFINPTGNAWRYQDELVPRLSEASPFIQSALDYANNNGLILNVEAVPFCFMQGYEKHVVELHMARERVMVDPDGVDSEYNEHRKAHGKFKRDDCSQCIYDPVCEGVWRNYEQIYGSSELSPQAQPARKVAEIVEQEPFEPIHGYDSFLGPMMVSYVALRNGIKPALLDSLPYGKYRKLKELCLQHHGITVLCSDYGVRFSQDGFGIARKPLNRKPDETVEVFMAGTHNEALELKKYQAIFHDILDKPGTAMHDKVCKRIGSLLGFPECCVDFFNKARKSALANYATLAYAQTKERFSWETNYGDFRTGQRSPYYLINHYPHAYDCSASISYAKKVSALVRKESPGFHQRLVDELQKPIVYFGPGRSAKLYGRRNGLRYAYNKILTTASDIEEDFVKGNECEVIGNNAFIYNDRQLVSIKPGARLLDFR